MAFSRRKLIDSKVVGLILGYLIIVPTTNPIIYFTMEISKLKSDVNEGLELLPEGLSPQYRFPSWLPDFPNPVLQPTPK